MENRELYLVAWVLYVLVIHGYAWWKRLSQRTVVLSHAAPSLVAILMTCIFLIGHGATVMQFVAYSELGMDLWSMWAGLWPLLVLATFVGGVAQVVWIVVVCVKREGRAWIPVALLGAAMCAFSFVTVMDNFPSV
jgi:hypothetical protein